MSSQPQPSVPLCMQGKERLKKRSWSQWPVTRSLAVKDQVSLIRGRWPSLLFERVNEWTSRAVLEFLQTEEQSLWNENQWFVCWLPQPSCLCDNKFFFQTRRKKNHTSHFTSFIFCEAEGLGLCKSCTKFWVGIELRILSVGLLCHTLKLPDSHTYSSYNRNILHTKITVSNSQFVFVLVMLYH